jgi:Na+-transporting NADH:ubiquinone oxidoreductase subunit C
MNTRHPAYVIGFMVLAAGVFGAAVTGLTLLTRPVVERNRVMVRQKALLRLFRLADPQTLSPAAVADLVHRRIDDSSRLRDPVTGWDTPLIRAYSDDARSQLIGYAFEFRGLGFWAPISGLLAVTADRDKTIGLVILSHTETPGLGGRIAEPVFTDQFARGLQIEPEAGKLLLYLAMNPPEAGSPGYGRSVMAITGATQTCFAMERILTDYLTRFHRAMTAADAAAAAVPGGR